jgi:hypothetical protein
VAPESLSDPAPLKIPPPSPLEPAEPLPPKTTMGKPPMIRKPLVPMAWLSWIDELGTAMSIHHPWLAGALRGVLFIDLGCVYHDWRTMALIGANQTSNSGRKRAVSGRTSAHASSPGRNNRGLTQTVINVRLPRVARTTGITRSTGMPSWLVSGYLRPTSGGTIGARSDFKVMIRPWCRRSKLTFKP